MKLSVKTRNSYPWNLLANNPCPVQPSPVNNLPLLKIFACYKSVSLYWRRFNHRTPYPHLYLFCAALLGLIWSISARRSSHAFTNTQHSSHNRRLLPLKYEPTCTFRCSTLAKSRPTQSDKGLRPLNCRLVFEIKGKYSAYLSLNHPGRSPASREFSPHSSALTSW